MEYYPEKLKNRKKAKQNIVKYLYFSCNFSSTLSLYLQNIQANKKINVGF